MKLMISFKKHFQAAVYVSLGLLLAGIFWVLMTSVGWQVPVRIFLVQSGSMEPSIMTGDVIITIPEQQYKVRDVITFYSSGDQRIVTHRISNLTASPNGSFYTTKGDANPEQDVETIESESVIGRVVLTLPRLGFLVSFGRTKWGMLLLLIVPGFVLLAREYRALMS